MSQVDDWSDGYTSDYLRNLNTYGPASANVPRSSVVSRQVQYQPPVAQTGVQTEAKTNDTPLYDNAGGFNPGPQRLASAPARPFRGNATATQRAARPKPAVKKNAQSASKQQTQSASKQQTQPEYRTGGARTPEENEIARSAAEHRTGSDLGQLSSQALDAAARFLPALKLLGFGAGAGSADTASTDRPSYMGAAGTMADNFARTLPQPSAASRQTAPESSSIEGQFKNMPWYEDAKAHHEAVKKNMDDYGYVLGTLKSTWDDTPWWAMVGPAGGPARAVAAEGSRLYGPVAERLLAPKGPLSGGTRTTLTSADEGLPVGYSILRNPPKADTSALAGQTSNLVQQLRAAGIPEDQIAASIARINAGAAGREAAAAGEAAAGREAAAAGEQAAGREAAAAGGQATGREAAAGEAAADGGVSELANAGAAGRAPKTGAGEAAGGAPKTGAGEAAGSVSEGVNSASQQLIEHIRSGTLDEMERAWIAAIADAVRVPGTKDESIQAILNEARFAGLIP